MLHLDGTRELRNTRQQDLRQEQQRPGLNLRQGTLKSPEQSRSRPPERRIGRTNNSRTKERIHAGSRPSSVRVKAFDGAAIIPNIPRASACYFIGLAQVRRKADSHATRRDAPFFKLSRRASGHDRLPQRPAHRSSVAGRFSGGENGNCGCHRTPEISRRNSPSPGPEREKVLF